jgi:hypothetical protein
MQDRGPWEKVIGAALMTYEEANLFPNAFSGTRKLVFRRAQYTAR